MNRFVIVKSKSNLLLEVEESVIQMPSIETVHNCLSWHIRELFPTYKSLQNHLENLVKENNVNILTGAIDALFEDMEYEDLTDAEIEIMDELDYGDYAHFLIVNKEVLFPELNKITKKTKK